MILFKRGEDEPSRAISDRATAVFLFVMAGMAAIFLVLVALAVIL